MSPYEQHGFMDYFWDGGLPMFPILAVGAVLLYASGRFAWDREPARLRLTTVLTKAVMVLAVQGVLLDVSKVLLLWAGWASKGWVNLSWNDRVTVALLGCQECLAPIIFGLALWGISLLLVAIGVYRSGQRELSAARGN